MTDLELLLQSIGHWTLNVQELIRSRNEKISTGETEFAMSWRECALCGVYIKGKDFQLCDSRCPIVWATGKHKCDHTPYMDLAWMRSDLIASEEEIEIAWLELDFL